jgi:hypothetical protein
MNVGAVARVVRETVGVGVAVGVAAVGSFLAGVRRSVTVVSLRGGQWLAAARGGLQTSAGSSPRLWLRRAGVQMSAGVQMAAGVQMSAGGRSSAVQMAAGWLRVAARALASVAARGVSSNASRNTQALANVRALLRRSRPRGVSFRGKRLRRNAVQSQRAQLALELAHPHLTER